MNLHLDRVISKAFLIFACLLPVILTGSGSGSKAAEKAALVELHTNLGVIALELYPERAPATVANFLRYVKEGHYQGTIFHRVIPGFMIQGGGFNEQWQPKPTRPPIPNEAANGLANEAYTVAMARTSDPHSATAQFFINVADNPFLNYTAANPQGWGYAVFGRVVRGKEVVDKIAALPTTTRGMHQNVPVQPVVITRAILVQP